MHTTKKIKIIIKENSYYSDLFFEASVLTPPKQHQKSSSSKKDAFKKKIMCKCHLGPIKDFRF
jgi:hypothetical protein